MNNKTIAQRFDELNQDRQCKLDRARECAELTIPGLLPENGLTENEELPVPYQSEGAKGVTSLASQIVATMYPLNGMSYFNFDLMAEEGADPRAVEQAEAMLADAEMKIQDRLRNTNFRAAAYKTVQHDIVVSDAVVYIDDNYHFTVYRLDQFVARRSPNGTLRELIIIEWVDTDDLPEELAGIGATKPTQPTAPSGMTQPSKRHEPMFTQVKFDDSGAVVTKEFRGSVFDSGTYTVTPYFVVQWDPQPGENYARSLCEENLGDLRSIDGVSKALLEGIAAASEYRPMVDPMGFTKLADLEGTENGKWVAARDEDVGAFTIDNASQLQTTLQARQLLSAALGEIFLRNSAVQPEYDRVTATAVRILAKELEQSLGGIFSTLTNDLLVPVIRRVIVLMQADGLLPDLSAQLLQDQELVSLNLRTGIEALGREVENAKMTDFIQAVAALPPDIVQKYIVWPEWLKRWAESRSIDTTGLIRSDDDVAAAEQLAQRNAMVQTAGEAAINAGAQQATQET